MGQHQGGALHGLNDLGHGVGLSRPGDAQENLFSQPVLDALGQLPDGLGLVAGGGIIGDHLEWGHGGSFLRRRGRRGENSFAGNPAYALILPDSRRET